MLTREDEQTDILVTTKEDDERNCDSTGATSFAQVRTDKMSKLKL
jgi:hypothetical protein